MKGFALYQRPPDDPPPPLITMSQASLRLNVPAMVLIDWALAVRFAWDADSRTVALIPCDPEHPDAHKMRRHGGRRNGQVSCSTFLRSVGQDPYPRNVRRWIGSRSEVDGEPAMVFQLDERV